MTFAMHDKADVPGDTTRALGRPTKFTQEVVSKILQALQQGATHKIAAAYGGISYDAFNHWINHSRIHGEESQYFPFHLMVEQNIAKGAVRSLEMIEASMPADWRAAAWRLSHGPYTRKDYADKVELTGADGEPLIPLAALRSLLDQATPSGDIDDDFADTNVSPIFNREAS